MTEQLRRREIVTATTEFIGGLTKVSTEVTKFGYLLVSESGYQPMGDHEFRVPADGNVGMYLSWHLPQDLQAKELPGIQMLNHEQFNQLTESLPGHAEDLKGAQIDVYYVGNSIVGLEVLPPNK